MNTVFRWIDLTVNRIAKNYTLWIAGGAIVLATIGFKTYALIFPSLLEPDVYASYMVLQTEWHNDRRERYYQTSQGSLVVPYAWFRALEAGTGTQLWGSPEVQVKYGLLPDSDAKYNPDQLPVGIVKEFVPDEYIRTLGQGQREWASLSCAACHTGQLLYKGTALRIDGDQSMFRFEQWSQGLVYSLILTSALPAKFERFCSRVYGYDVSKKCENRERELLRAQMKTYFDSDLVMDAVNAVINHTYPAKEGFARTNALGRGVNGPWGPLDPSNITVSTGPVSYPPLWYTHYFDWVQSPAAIRQPLGRNVTEAWGVNVRVELNDPVKRFGSTAELDNMYWMETLLSTLRPPKWPENVLGPIDPKRVERGRYLFNDAVWNGALPAEQAELQPSPAGFIGRPNPNRPTSGYCARCHTPALDPQPDNYGKRYIQLPLYRLSVMGTDPDDAMQFNTHKIYPGVLAPLYGNQVVGIGTALTVSVTGILNKWFKDHNISDSCQTIMEGYRKNLFRAPLGYPARPLDGYWATGPFLHNGSVRTLYQLLSPANEREKSFWIGTREFDPVTVGFQDEPVQGAFLFDTTLAGNSNGGHEFRDAPPNTPGVIGPLLTPEQRVDIIEYLKVLNSVEALVQAEQGETTLALDAAAPFYENSSGPIPVGAPEQEGGFAKKDFCEATVKAVTTLTVGPEKRE